MLELRVRNRLRKADLDPKVGHVLGPKDYDVVLTGPARVSMPDGKPLCVYLPGVLKEHTDNDLIYGILHDLRVLRTDNRGNASGTTRVLNGAGTRSRSLPVSSTIIGAMDPAGTQKYCRLTAWTGRNLPHWQALNPLFRAVAAEFAMHVPDRYAIQDKAANQTPPEWVIPGTPFSTVTVNNTYPTGMHVDKGDLETGFSTIACFRRGAPYEGGRLMFPEYRVAVDLHDGDLILMDAHQWHANEAIECDCGTRLKGQCPTCKAERISVVSYFRTRIMDCGTAEDERHKAAQRREVHA